MGKMDYPYKGIGIIGGGQLGKMIAQEAQKMGIAVHILDPDPHAPAASVANTHIQAPYTDFNAFKELAALSDVITYEREDITVQNINALSAEGIDAFHPASVLQLTQDKSRQKAWLVAEGIPTTPFQYYEAITPHDLIQFGFPLVQKAAYGGYDGKGVSVIQNESQLSQALSGPCILENVVDVQTELAIVVARSKTGEIKSYPVVEMVFNENNVLDILLAPARITAEQTQKIQAIAEEIIHKLKGVGVFGIEFFVDQDGHVLVNEISARPHNSGHYTIEACVTSQYEQHIRAIMGWPLGSTALLSPVAMLNVLGEGKKGRPHIMGLESVFATEGATLHLYGKHQVAPGRKMGHVSILDASLEQALEKATTMKHHLSIQGG